MLLISDKEFWQLSAYIKENYGINLKKEKKALVSGRLNNVLAKSNFNNYSEYIKHIMQDKTGNSAATLINKITTNHTFFMREAEHFSFFKNRMLPQLKSTLKDKDIRIWSAGCSSGEEPYTIAMILDEFFGREKALWDCKVLATDISDTVLDIAKKGLFRNEGINTLPTFWKHNYFRKIDSEWSALVETIKNEVIYRKFNLMEEVFPFKKKFDVIFCRNVMIYFDEQTRIKLVEKFYDSMEYGGYFFIGHSESLNRQETRFKYIMPAIYRKE